MDELVCAANSGSCHEPRGGLMSSAIRAACASLSLMSGLFGVSTVAMAQGNWSGGYVGVHLGGAWTSTDWADVSLLAEPVSTDASGFIGGGHIGFLQQYNGIVFGIEASLSGADLNETVASASLPAIVSYSTKIDMIATVTARIGLPMNEFLPYLKVGYAGGNVTTSGSHALIPDAFSTKDWEHGWTVGGGIEFKISENLTAGAEYSYIDLGGGDRNGITNTGIPYTITGIDTEIHSVTARLTYRFGERRDVAPLK